MTKTSSMIVAGVLILAGLTAAVALGAAYNPQGLAYQQGAVPQQPYAQGWSIKPYGRGGMMGGGFGMMGGRGMMGYGYTVGPVGNGSGWSLSAMIARCGTLMRSLWGNQTGTLASNQIAIAGYGYTPQVVTIKVGTTLTWTNYDSEAHTVDSGTPTNPTSLFDSGSISPGASFSYIFAQAGTHPYYCDLHAGMAGVVIVEP